MLDSKSKLYISANLEPLTFSAHSPQYQNMNKTFNLLLDIAVDDVKENFKYAIQSNFEEIGNFRDSLYELLYNNLRDATFDTYFNKNQIIIDDSVKSAITKIADNMISDEYCTDISASEYFN